MEKTYFNLESAHYLQEARPFLRPQLMKSVLAWRISMQAALAMLAYRIAPSRTACFSGFTAALLLGFAAEWNKASLYKRYLALKTPSIAFSKISLSEGIREQALLIMNKQQEGSLNGYLLSRTFSILLRDALPLALAALLKNYFLVRPLTKCYQFYTMAVIGLAAGTILATRRPQTVLALP